MKTYKVTSVLEMVSYVDADSEGEALEVARELYPSDADTVVDERVEELAGDEDDGV